MTLQSIDVNFFAKIMREIVFFVVQVLFNRDLNRGWLVYKFSLRFSGSKFRVRKIFSCA